MDDKRLFVESLEVALRSTSEVTIVGLARRRDAAVSTIDLRDPDAVVVDLELEGEDAEALVEELTERYPRLPVVVLTERGDPETVLGSIRAGARGVVLKTSSVAELASAVEAAREGRNRLPASLVPPALAGEAGGVDTAAAERALGTLTPREREVLSELMAGADTAGVARTLGVSAHTARAHARHVLSKLGVGTPAEAVAVAWLLGLRPPRRRRGTTP